MKNFIKAIVITVVILAALIIANIICNKTGHELDALYTGVITPIVAMVLYDRLADKKEKNTNAF
ncbi:hypothetical protein SAMN04487770_11861 [Butyrivibrio sp. ob235]|uniref:hypothetical protein n=1 Tax=Butyrivibrio sp. ob235 TaxID=1761780 RepID=UPI0008C985B8|nr:hypothetical protein [Butyrivibrio sp. ob235]SEL83039.1 hypothetical protein SAMN04487770_11861 [Butyrivibrio sp. ob235]